jgi:hypothetical protein
VTLQANQRRYDSAHDLVEDYFARGWTDGLPIVPPTPELVQAFVDHAGLPPEAPVAELSNWGAVTTVEHVAINAVMAGCRPEYLPVVLAAVRALCRPEANTHSTAATLANPAQIVIVNGPVRREIGIQCEQGCFGPGFRANATIGRAVRLVIRNVFGAVPGGLDRSVFSTPGRFAWCFGENEEASPWTPLHVERGIDPGRSAVTVFSSYPMLVVASEAAHTVDQVVDFFVQRLQADTVLWEHRMGAPTDMIVVMALEHMRAFADAGWTKQTIRAAMWDRLMDLPGLAGTKVEGRPVRLDGPEAILVVAAGGPGNPFTVLLTPHAGRAATEPLLASHA